MTMEIGACRACRAPVRWAISAKSGKPMPLEPAPETGNVVVDGDGLARVFGDHAKAEAAIGTGSFPLGVTYISHHATCPEAERFRSQRRPPKPKAAVPETLFPSDEPRKLCGGRAVITPEREELAQRDAERRVFGNDVRHYFVGSTVSPPVGTCRRCFREPSDDIHLQPPAGA